jgi:aminoglycoside/choline kinase family phosphotransferase
MAPSAPMTPPAAAGAFLESCGWAGAVVEPLAGDASFRRYFRVRGEGRCAVLMDAPPPHEDPRPFVAIAEWLGSVGLTAPHVIAADLDRGLLLLADLGDDRFKEALDRDPARERDLYERATDLLVHLHRQPVMAGLKPHGLDQWLEELDLFLDWYVPAAGLTVDRDGWREAWTEVLDPVANDGLSPVTVLRDYHAENVMLVDGREGVAALGLLDFQDALAGHPAYDLASLLEDARRDVSPQLERAMLDRYRAAMGQGEAFERAYWTLAAQRNTRILGVFRRLWKRDGKPGYRKFQPRMWGLLDRDLEHMVLAPVRDWFETNVPAASRAALWTEHA